MKKLLFGLLLFSVSLLGYTENTVDQINTTIKDATGALKQATSEVNPTVVYFTEKLQELAKSLKVPAEYVYKTLVQKQTVTAWSNLFMLLLTFLIAVILYVITIKSWNNKNNKWRKLNQNSNYLKNNPEYKYYDLYSDWWSIGLIISGAIFLIALIVTFIIGSDIILGIFNPEYGAIKEIMELF